MLDQRGPTGRVDVAAFKRRHPIGDVVARYGIDLRPVGRARVGYCPFHDDRRKPNLYVYDDTDSWCCYRCRIGGDGISFVERIEGVDFRTAVDRLERSIHGGACRVPVRGHDTAAAPARLPGRTRRGAEGSTAAPLDPDVRACLAAAVELYANRLLSDSTALAYVAARGLDRNVAERYRLGYAAGGELLDFLRWRRLPREAAERAGLIGRDGHEFFAGRVVVPELRGGWPVWAVGRAVESGGSGVACADRPKYLGLPGRKPLLGWEDACAAVAAPSAEPGAVCVTEGVFDWLALCAWKVPALSLVGTHASREHLAALERFPRLYLVLDSDEAGRDATADLAAALGDRAVAVRLPHLPGVKDVADLALREDGRERFRQAIAAADAAAQARSCAAAA